jgi:hypothetical protein
VTDGLFTVIVVALGVLLGAALVVLIALTIVAIDARLDARRRRRAARSSDDDEAPDALAAFGVDISVWPSRAPRNGQSHEEASA